MRLSPEQRPVYLASLTSAERELVYFCWPIFARKDQRPPSAAANGEPWTTWFLIGGRGAGKTRAGAEWVRALAMGDADFAGPPARRIALVGETLNDAREVMIEGEASDTARHSRRQYLFQLRRGEPRALSRDGAAAGGAHVLCARQLARARVWPWVRASIESNPDLDQVSALASERESLWARVNAATFLTDDENRAAVGYGARV